MCLAAEKGYFGLLDALAAVGPSNGGAELVVVGDGPMAAAVRARARELGLLDRIRFAGARAENETLAEIAHADILVLPSLLERSEERRGGHGWVSPCRSRW